MLHIDEMFNLAGVTEMIYEAKEELKYAHWLEGFTFAEASELWFAALNK
jgi:hypothetical protein